MATALTTNLLEESNDELLVIFRLGTESFGVTIHEVSTIIRITSITELPQAPHAVIGIINLREVIVPIIDLRARFALAPVPQTRDSRIVVIEHDSMQIGLLVDAVTETLRLPAQSIEPMTTLTTSIDNRYFRGIGKVADKLIILLAMEHLIDSESEALCAELAA